MAELKLTANRTPIDPPTKPDISGTSVKFEDPRLTKALLKASFEHQSLSPADREALEKVFGTGNAGKVKDFLSINGDNFTDKEMSVPALRDLKPFGNVPLNQVNDKMVNSVDEVLELEKRLITLLGTDNYNKSGIKKQIEGIKTALVVAKASVDAGENAEDTFSKEVDYRLADRARINPEKKGNDKLKNVSDEAIALGFMAIGATKDPKVNGLFETPVAIEAFKVTNIPKKEDAKAWLTYLFQAQADGVPPADQRIPRSLLRKLRNLETEPDLEVFKELTKCLNVPVSDELAQSYQTFFNNSIGTLKANAKSGAVDPYDYSSDKELAASLECMKINTDGLTLSKDQAVTLGRAQRFLTDDNLEIDRLLEKKVIKDALVILNTIPDFKTAYAKKVTDDEKKVFLKQMLTRIAIDRKDKDPVVRTGDINPMEEDPLKLYQDFTKTMEYLHAEINDPARSEANRENLKKEFERFFGSGEVGPLLKEFTGNGEDEKLATALNLFRYDKRNLGLIKSLFNKTDSKSKVPAFNIIDLIRDKANQDLSDISRQIEVAVIRSGQNGNASKVPPELVDSSVKTKTEHVFSGAVFYPDTAPNPNKDIKERITLNSFSLFTKLGLDPFLTTGKIKLVDGKMMMQSDKKTEEIPENLRTLLKATIVSNEVNTETNDKDLIDILVKGGVLTKSGGTNEYAFHEDSKKGLMFAIATGAASRNEAYNHYQGYDPDTNVSFEKLLDQRGELIKLSNKYRLGMFRATPILQPYYSSEYRDSLVSLAVSLPHFKGHYDTNIRPYEEEPNEKGQLIQRPDNVKSPVFGIDPSKGKNIERKTSALDSKKPVELYAVDTTHIRALTKEIFDSFLRDDHYRRPSLFDFDEPRTKNDDFGRSHPQFRDSRFNFLIG